MAKRRKDPCSGAPPGFLYRQSQVGGDVALDEAVTESEAESFAWDTVKRVERLTELAVRFPEQLRKVARHLPAWPVLRSPRESANWYYWRVIRHLEVARDYPLDTSGHARSHPENQMGRYVTRWVERLHWFGMDLAFAREMDREQGKSDPDLARRCWQGAVEQELPSEFVTVLKLVPKMTPLTKATSDEWSSRVLVPMIMLSDAGDDEASCKEPALQAIWRQSGVKSRATFRSRLLTKVQQTLRSMARPA